MTGRELAASLRARGIDPHDANEKSAMFARVLSHTPASAHHDLHVWWVPGRLEVFGKHTDYGGGRTLVCAVPRGFAVTARPRTDDLVHIVDAHREQEVILAPARPIVGDPPTGWRNYANVVCRRLARNFPGASLAADIVLASDLPRASGMSSSTAFVVAVASALVRIGNLERRPEWVENIRGPFDVAGYFASLENGLSFGRLSGDSGVGTHGGSEDHAAILTSAPGQLRAFAFAPLRDRGSVPLPDHWRFVIAPSGVAARKAGEAREAYNRLADGVRVLLDLWNDASPAPEPSLAAALWSSGTERADPARVERLRSLVAASRIAEWPGPSLERRLDHFVREDARTPEAFEAFRAEDAARLGALAKESQADAETLLGNQIPATTAMVFKARDLGAFAACNFGAGFGGSLWALVDRDRAESFARAWHPDAFIAVPGPALVDLIDR